jgi:hypothetical protein
LQVGGKRHARRADFLTPYFRPVGGINLRDLIAQDRALLRNAIGRE